MVFQEGALFDSLTVRENVGYKLFEELNWTTGRRQRAASRKSSASSAWPSSSTASRRSCRAASGGAWRSPGRWRPSRASCSTTSRRPVSIRLRRSPWTRKSSSCATSKGSARSSSPTSCATRSTSPSTRRSGSGSERGVREGLAAEDRRGGVHHAARRQDRVRGQCRRAARGRGRDPYIACVSFVKD